MVVKCYRFVTSGLKSKRGDVYWVPRRWVKHDGELSMQYRGLHASINPVNSIIYAMGERWFTAEARGKILEDKDKICASEMRILREIPLRVIQEFAMWVFTEEHHNKQQFKDSPNILNAFEGVRTRIFESDVKKLSPIIHSYRTVKIDSSFNVIDYQRTYLEALINKALGFWRK